MGRRSVILDHIDGRAAAALLVDGRLEDLFIDPPADAPPAPGAIFRAIADRPVKGVGGQFLRLPGGLSGFLRTGGKPRAPGRPLIVQVTGYPEPGKAVPLSERVLFKSRYAIVTPDSPGVNVSRSLRDEDLRDALVVIGREEMEGCPFGLILRSAAAGAEETALREDIAATRELAEAVMADREGGPELLVDAPDAHLLAWREWADPAPDEVVEAAGALGHHGVMDMLDDLLEVEVPLSTGGVMAIEPTRAVVAVDVNTGGDFSPAAALKTNIAAARALPRQLRLRGLGGQVVIDFAPLARRDRRQLEQVLKAAFRSDPVETIVVGWTTLGMVELQRRRERLPLREVLPR